MLTGYTIELVEQDGGESAEGSTVEVKKDDVSSLEALFG